MGQTVATRHNNPLNIKYGPATKKWVESGNAELGEDAKDGGKFLRFKSPDIGYQAARDLLSSENYRDLDVDSALKKWSNNGYGADVAEGIDPVTKIADLDEEQQDNIVKNMAKREGYEASPTVNKPSDGKSKQYKITDNKSGETFVISSSTTPTKEHAKELIKQRRTNKREAEINEAYAQEAHGGIVNKIAEAVPEVVYDAYNLAKKPSEAIAPKVMAPEDVKKLPTTFTSGGNGVLGSIADVVSGGSRLGRKARELYSGLIEPENIAATAGTFLPGGQAGLLSKVPAAMKTAVPAYFGAKMLGSAPQAIENLIKDPSLETGIDAAELAAGLGLSAYGTYKGLKGTPPKVNAPTDWQGPKANSTALERAPIEAEFVDDLPGEYEVRGPKQLTGKVGNEKAGDFGQPGPIITPPPEPSTSEGRRYYKGGPIVKNETPEQIVDNLEKGPEAKSEVKAPIKNEWLRQQDPKVLETMKPGASPEVQAEIDQVIKEKQEIVKANEEIDKNFKPNIKVKPPEEIETEIKKLNEESENVEDLDRVLSETPKEDVDKTLENIERTDKKRISLTRALENAKKFNDQTAIEKYTKKLEELDNPKVVSPYENQKPKLEEQLQDSLDEQDKEAFDEGEVPESKVNEEQFKKYSNILIKLESSNVSSISVSELRGIAKAGKDAGLDHETVINDLVERTSGITNNVGKVWTAVNKVYMEDISEMGSEDVIPKIDPRLVEIMGGNLNSRDLGRVAAQELVQNALDPVRELGENGKVSVHFDSKNKTISVKDNGTGMLPEVVKKEFLEPGGSKKPAGSTGGFGIAKIPLFSNSETIGLETVAKDANGKFIRSSAVFSGADWATFSKPIKVHSEEVSPRETGSTITLKLNPSVQADSYYTEEYLKDFLKTHRLKTKFDFNIDNSKIDALEYHYDDNYNRVALPAEKIAPIDTFKFPGGKATVSISEKTHETGYLPVRVLSNGMPQFVESFYIKEGKYPKQIIIDVSPTVKAGHVDYPFKLDREGLREDANKAMHEWIKGTLVASAAFKELETYKGALKSAIPFGKGDFKIYNTDGSATPAIVNSIARDIQISTVINNIGVVHKMMQDELAKVGKKSVSDFKGLGLGKYLGVNISGSLATGVSSNKNMVLVNPFNIYREANQLVVDGYLREKDIPNMLASQIFATMLHELSHDEERGHDVPMIGAFTRNVGFSGKVTNKLIDQLERTITNDTIASISSFSNQLSSLTRGEDVFNKISVETPTSISGGQGGNIKVNAPNEGRGSGQQKAIEDSGGHPSEELATSKDVESGEFPLTKTRPKEKGSFRPFAKSKAKSFTDGKEVKKESKDFGTVINNLLVASGDAVRRFGNNTPAAQEISRLMQKERTVRNILIGRYQVKLNEAGVTTDRVGGPKNLSDEEVGNYRVKDSNGNIITIIQGDTAGANEGKFIHYDNGKIVANKGFELVGPVPGNLIDVLEKNAAPMNEKVARTAKAINELQDKLGDLAERSGAGIRVGETVVKFSKTPGGYFKHKFSESFFDSLGDDPRNIETILNNIAKKEGITEGQAKAYINDSRKYGEIAFAPQHQMLTGYDSFIRDRSVFYDHIREFGNKVGTAAVVGPRDVNGPLLNGLLETIKKEGGQTSYIRAILERNFNRDPIDPFVESANKFYHAVSSVMAARYLPFFAISDLATLGNIGMRGSLDKLLPAIIHNFKSQDLLKKSIMKTGALSEHITDSLAPEGLVQRMYLMKPVERFLRSTASEVGRGSAVDDLKVLKTKKPDSYFYKLAYSHLKNLLLENDEGMAKLIAKGKLSEFQTDFAGGRMAEMTQGLVDPVDTPHYWNNKSLGLVGDFLMTYKRYAYQSTRMLFQAVKENPAKTIPMILFVMPAIGELLGDAKAGLKGGIAGSVTGEGTLDAAIREIEDRGAYLARVLPIFKTHPHAARLVDDYLSSWAFGLLSDGLMATLEGPSGLAEFFAGPGAAILGEIGSSIKLILSELAKDTDFAWDKLENDLIKYVPGGEGATIKRSEKEEGKGGGIVVHPPKLPTLP